MIISFQNQERNSSIFRFSHAFSQLCFHAVYHRMMHTLLVMFLPAGARPLSFLFLKMIIDSLPIWRDRLQWIDVGDWGKSREWQGAIVSTVFVVEPWLHRDAWGRVDAGWIFFQLSPWLLDVFWLSPGSLDLSPSNTVELNFLLLEFSICSL